MSEILQTMTPEWLLGFGMGSIILACLAIAGCWLARRRRRRDDGPDASAAVLVPVMPLAPAGPTTRRIDDESEYVSLKEARK